MKFASILLLIAVFLPACQGQQSSDDANPSNPESVAQEILSSTVYREYTEVAKEIQLVMLHDVREGAKTLNVTELAGLKNGSDIAAYLKENGYQRAAKLHELIERSEILSKSLLDLFHEIQGRVGVENFQNGLTYIDDHAPHTYKITAEEALNFKH